MLIRSLLVAVLAGASIFLLASAHSDPPPIGSMDALAVDVAQLELSPEAVSASGLHSSLQALLDQVEQAGTLRQALAAKRNVLGTASENVTALEAALRQSDGNAELLAQHQVAIAQLQTLQGELATLDGQLLAAATLNLPEAGVQKLNIFRQSEGRRVPAEFRVKSLTAEQWDNVESALIAERRAQRMGQTLDPEVAALLTSLRGDVEVIQAASNLQATLAQDQALFAAAIAVESPEP
jgi:hypothetical protein